MTAFADLARQLGTIEDVGAAERRERTRAVAIKAAERELSWLLHERALADPELDPVTLGRLDLKIDSARGHLARITQE